MDKEKQSRKDNGSTVKWYQMPLLSLKGFLMGSADIVPGVSGGTMALIVGIYEQLINAIKSVDLEAIRLLLRLKIADAFKRVHLTFLVPLFAGIFAALIFFTRVVPLQIYMFTHPEIVYGLFFGLIVGSIYILVKALPGFGFRQIFALLAGVGIGFWVVNLVPADTPDHPLFVLISGSIAICAMILPGISGSYLLLIMKKYEYLLLHIGMIGGDETLDGLLGLLPFMIGAVVGLALFSRFLSWLLDHYKTSTLSVLIGFMIGSLLVIWPFQEREFVEQVRETIEVPVDDPRVKELQQRPNEELPEFERLGSTTSNGMVEIKTIKKKLIHSEPYFPDYEAANKDEKKDIRGGWWGMLIGFVLVGGLDQLRKYSEKAG